MAHLHAAHPTHVALASIRSSNSTEYKYLAGPDSDQDLTKIELVQYATAMIGLLRGLVQDKNKMTPRTTVYIHEASLNAEERAYLSHYMTRMDEDTLATKGIVLYSIQETQYGFLSIVFQRDGNRTLNIVFVLNPASGHWQIMVQTEYSIVDKGKENERATQAVTMVHQVDLFEYVQPPHLRDLALRLLDKHVPAGGSSVALYKPLDKPFVFVPPSVASLSQPPPRSTPSTAAAATTTTSAGANVDRNTKEMLHMAQALRPTTQGGHVNLADVARNHNLTVRQRNIERNTIHLTPEQRSFAAWMQSLWAKNMHRSVILADEVGGGKTFAVLAALQEYPDFHTVGGRFLLLVPRSSMEQTKREIDRMRIPGVCEFRSASAKEGVKEEDACDWTQASIVLTTTEQLRMQHKIKLATDPRWQGQLLYAPMPPVGREMEEDEEEDEDNNHFAQGRVMSQDLDDTNEATEEDEKKEPPVKVDEDVQHQPNLYDVMWSLVVLDEAHLRISDSIKRPLDLSVKPDSNGGISPSAWIKPNRVYLYALKRKACIPMTGTLMTNTFRDPASIALWCATSPTEPLISVSPWFWKRVDRWTPGDVQAWRDLCIRRRLDKKRVPGGIVIRSKKQPLTKLQQALEEAVLVKDTNERGRTTSFSIQNYTLLRKISLSAELLTSDERRSLVRALPKDVERDDSKWADDKDVISAAVDFLVGAIQNQSYKRRIVIFSEWTRLLVLLKQRLVHRLPDKATQVVAIPIFSGSMNETRRNQVLDDFRRPSEEIHHCILFMTRGSGGVSLNLQSASIVMDIGEWFQRVIRDQVIGRLYRPGQQRQVEVYPLTSIGGRGTQREISAIARRKEKASHILVGLLEPGAILTDADRKVIRDFLQLAANHFQPTDRRNDRLQHDIPLPTNAYQAFEQLVDIHAALYSQFETAIFEWPDYEVRSFYKEDLPRVLVT